MGSGQAQSIVTTGAWDDALALDAARPGTPLPDPHFAPARASGYFVWPPVWFGDRPSLDFMMKTLPADAGDFFEGLGAEILRCSVDQDIVVRMHRDGLVVFDFTHATVRTGLLGRDYNGGNRFMLRQQLLNAHVACLATIILERMHLATALATVEHADVLSMGTPDSIGAAFGAHSRAPSLVLARFPVSYAPGLPLLHDWRMTFRAAPVSADCLAAACELLTSAMRHEEDDLIPFVDIWQRSCAAVHAMNYALAVVLAWTVIEAMIDRFWQRYLDANRSRTVEGAEMPFIRADRRKRLNDRQYTAAIRTEILSLTGELDSELYERCADARQARNFWLHDMKPVSYQAAMNAVATAALLIEKRSSVRLRFAGGGAGYHEQPGIG